MSSHRLQSPASASTVETSSSLAFSWNQYRGWALVARRLQKRARLLAGCSLVLAALAALFGAAASTAPESWGIEGGIAARPSFSLIAAALAALAAIPALASNQRNADSDQIRSRAVAETIKSECFRYLAGLQPYATLTAPQLLLRRVEQINQEAREAGLIWSAANTVERDPRLPEPPLTLASYLQMRMRDQISFYGIRQRAHERALAWLGAAGWLCTIATVLLGVAGGTISRDKVAPWIGFATTLSASLIAFGLMDRRKYLIASYAATQSKLRAIEAAAMDSQVNLSDLVTQTEDLLQAEHLAWVTSMRRPGGPEPRSATVRQPRGQSRSRAQPSPTATTAQDAPSETSTSPNQTNPAALGSDRTGC